MLPHSYRYQIAVLCLKLRGKCHFELTKCHFVSISQEKSFSINKNQIEAYIYCILEWGHNEPALFT